MSSAETQKTKQKSKRKHQKSEQKQLHARNLFPSVMESPSQQSSTSTSKFGVEKTPDIRKSEDFTSFTSSLNTDLETVPLKPGFSKASSDPAYISNKINNLLISSGTKYRIPEGKVLKLEDLPDLIERLV